MNGLYELAKSMLKEIIAERDCFYEGITTSSGCIPDEDDWESLNIWDSRIDEAQAVLDRYKKDMDGHYLVQIPKEITPKELNHPLRIFSVRLNRHGEGVYRAMPTLKEAA